MVIRSTINRIKNNIWLLYTCLFVLTAAGVFIWHILAGKSFIWYIDGVGQHFRTFIYYSRYLKNIIRSLLDGQGFVAPHWEHGLSSGADVIGLLNSYGFADPFFLITVFIPQRFLPAVYDLLVIIKLYLAGIFFIFLGKAAINNAGNIALTAGALSYCLSLLSVFYGTMHQNSLNNMIFLPLLILGIYKVIEGQRPYLLIIVVALISSTGLAGCFRSAVIAATYVIVKLIDKYKKDVKEIVKKISILFIYALLGVFITSIIVLPMAYFILNNPRLSNNENVLRIVYDLKYYLSIPGNLFSVSGDSNGDEVFISFVAPQFISVVLLYTRKDRVLKLLGIISGLSLLLPVCGKILNCMVYPSNRWNYAIVLFSAYTLTFLWDELMKLTKTQKAVLWISTAIVTLLSLFSVFNNNKYTLCGIILSFACISILCIEASPQIKGRVIAGLVIVNILADSYFYFSPNETGYINENVDLDKAMDKEINNISVPVQAAVAAEGDTGFFRYTGSQVNTGLLSGLSATDFDWSYAEPYSVLFRTDLEHNKPRPSKFTRYDKRTIINSLFNVKYCVVDHDSTEDIPYGYSYFLTAKGDGDNEYDVYKNDHFLPLGYTYDSFIRRDYWLGYNAVERESTMLDKAVLSDADEAVMGYEKADTDPRVKTVGYTMKPDDHGIYLDGNTVYVTEDYAGIRLDLDGDTTGGELMCEAKGIDYRGVSRYDLYYGKDELYDPKHEYNKEDIGDMTVLGRIDLLKDKLFFDEPKEAFIAVVESENNTAEMEYMTRGNNLYAGRRDFVANTGYHAENVESLYLAFKKAGVYNIDEINVYLNPLEDYAERVDRLKENVLTDISFGNDTVSGMLSYEKPGLLCMSIPYSKGWSAYIDGTRTHVYQANDMFMAINVPAGEHSIEFRYETPFFRLGSIVSLLAIAGFVIMIIISEKKRIWK